MCAIVAWGDNASGQCAVPAPNAGFTAIAAGYLHSLGLKADGAIVAWGYNDLGQCDVPQPNTGFTAIAGGTRSPCGWVCLLKMPSNLKPLMLSAPVVKLTFPCAT